MHDKLFGKSDKSVSGFEADVAALLVYALEWERHKLEKAGRLYRYGMVIVCESCLREHIVDYLALSLERSGSKRCELCGRHEPLLFHLCIVDSLRKRIEEIRQANRR